MHQIRAALGGALRALSAPALAALALAALPGAAAAQQEHGQHAPARKAAKAAKGADSTALLDGLGKHHYAITTSSPMAQRYFDQGLSLAYAFNHAEARRSFLEASRLDPACAMCQWGVALVLGPNINAPMDTAANAEAHAASRRAAALAEKATPVERALAEALTRRYAERPVADRAPLDSAYAAAMADVARRFPDDAEAATLFAEATMDLSPWAYWTKDRTPRPGTAEMLGALEGVLKRDPDHPGACHLYIHAVEAAYPERAVPCAERLAALMPAAGHIVHMPAHIYLRVGRYDDAIAANEHAVHADQSYITDRGSKQSFYAIGYYPHNYDFLAFAATLAGQREKAVAAARAAAANTPPDVARDVLELQLLSAYPHVTLVTFGRWDEALREPMPRADLRLARGLAWYARGVARASTGQSARAAAALDSVRAAAAALTATPTAGPVLRIAAHSLAGEIAARRGRADEAVAELTSAMQIEDSLSYMEPPYWRQPVRHRLGAALVKARRAAEAEALFREDLARFPENVWSLRGLELSLAAQGRDAEATQVRERFARASKKSDVRLAASKF